MYIYRFVGALFDTSFDRAIFALAIPALGSLIVEPLVRTAEAVMVGRLGAGTNLNLYVPQVLI